MLYLLGGVGYSVKVQGKAPGLAALPHQRFWAEAAGCVRDGLLLSARTIKAKAAEMRGGAGGGGGGGEGGYTQVGDPVGVATAHSDDSQKADGEGSPAPAPTPAPVSNGSESSSSDDEVVE